MHQYLLPIELWMRIFQEVGIEEWLQLLVTCHLFYPLAQAGLYKEIRVDRRPNKNDDFLQNFRAILAAQTFAARPDLSGLVHSLWLYSECQDRFEHQMLMDVFSHNPVLRHLDAFSSLRVFTLRGFHIDAECYTAIRSLTHLEHLEVSLCDIDPDLSEKFPHLTLGNAMSRLSINQPVAAQGWAVLTSPGIQSLTLDLSFRPSSFLDSVLSDLIRVEVHKTLTELVWKTRTHTRDGYHPSLRHFMELCTELRIMRHASDTAFAHRMDIFSPGAMSRLTKFEGPAKYAQMFVPGRPVYSVSLKFYRGDPTNALQALKFSSVPVTDLKLFQDRRALLGYVDFGLLLEHAPRTLRRISWDGNFHKKQLQSWLPLFSCNTNLYSIRLSADSVIFQQDIVQRVAEACVSVREVNFFSGESWIWRREESWEYYPKRV